MRLTGDIIEKLNIKYEPSSDEVLHFIRLHDKMSLETVLRYMKEQEINRVLDRHPYRVYQQKDGRWSTYIKDTSKKYGRRRVVKPTEVELYTELYHIYKMQDEREVIKKMTLLTLYPRWLEYKNLHTNAPTTIARHNVDWKKYYIGTDIVTIPILKLDRLTLDQWAHHLIREHNLTKKQYYNLAVIMRQALDFAVEKGYIEENWFAKINIDKRLFRPDYKKENRTQVFLEDEEKAIKEYAWECFRNGTHTKQPLTALAILFQFQTGLRIGELRALRYGDISSDGKSISVSKMIRNETGEVVEHTKGAFGDRVVQLTDEAIRIIEVARATQEEKGAPTDGFIFSMNDKPIGYSAINKAYYSYCDHVGTVRKSTHKVRKTVISSLIDAGMNIDAIRRFAGHTSERTTYNNYCYDRRSDEANREILNSALA